MFSRMNYLKLLYPSFIWKCVRGSILTLNGVIERRYWIDKMTFLLSANSLSTGEFIRKIFHQTRNQILKQTAKIFSNMGVVRWDGE